MQSKIFQLTQWRLSVICLNFMFSVFFLAVGCSTNILYLFVAMQFFLVCLPEIMSLTAVGFCASSRPLLALRIANGALLLDDTNILGMWSKACCLLYGGELDGALATSSEIVKMYPQNVLGYKIRSIVRLNYCEFAEGVEDCKAVLAREPRDCVALINRAHAYLHMGKFEDCIADCDTVLKLKGLQENAYLAKCSALLELRRFEEAQGILTSLEALPGKAFLVPLCAALLHCWTYRFTDALKLCATAPADAHAKVFLHVQCDTYIGLSEGELAMQCAEALITEYPHFYSGYFYRATIFCQAGLIDEAVKDCNMVLSLQPYLSMVNGLSAQLHLAKQEFDQCLFQCDQALLKNNFDVEAMAVKALSLVAMNRGKEALVLIEGALTIDSKNCNCLVAMAQAVEQTKDAHSALPWLDKAITANPHSRFAYLVRSQFLEKTGDLEHAKVDRERYDNMKRQLISGLEQKLLTDKV